MNIEQSLIFYSYFMDEITHLNAEAINPEWFSKKEQEAYHMIITELDEALPKGKLQHLDLCKNFSVQISMIIWKATETQKKFSNIEDLARYSPYRSSLALYLKHQLESVMELIKPEPNN